MWTLQAWKSHGRAHRNRDAAEAKRAATFVSAASVELTDAQLTSVPPAAPPREAYAALASVDLTEALAPGQRTVQFIPRPLKAMAFAAFTAALSACTATARVTIDASKALAVFAFYGLGVGKADLAIEPGETCPPADVRRARDSTISRQLGLLAHGRFSEAGAIAARRAASERSAAASGDTPAPAAESEDDGGSEQLSASTIRAVHLQCALGNPGKGAGRLVATPAAAFCGTTFIILLELHPPARHAIPAALMSVVVEPVKATTEALVAVLGKLRRGVAAGCSGLTNDHLRSLFPVDTEPEQEALGPLLRFVNKALAADMDEETADWLCASVLVALYKPDGEGGLKRRASDDGLLDVRPIAIPETLYRLVALCGLHMCKVDITAKLTEIKQLGVDVRLRDHRIEVVDAVVGHKDGVRAGERGHSSRQRHEGRNPTAGRDDARLGDPVRVAAVEDDDRPPRDEGDAVEVWVVGVAPSGGHGGDVTGEHASARWAVNRAQIVSGERRQRGGRVGAQLGGGRAGEAPRGAGDTRLAEGGANGVVEAVAVAFAR